MAKDVFARVERKYMLTLSQYAQLRPRILRHMEPDRYGRYTIGNIYYDTPEYALVRRSIEKPSYKEKLRLRGYGTPTADSGVFLEIKKKYRGIVYKRRVAMPLSDAYAYLTDGTQPNLDLLHSEHSEQILRELDWFRTFYHPQPAVYLAYDREAYAGRENPELRLTFDTGIRYRETKIDLAYGTSGAPLLTRDRVLMEVKIPGAMPMWMARDFAELGIYGTSYSKYGSWFTQRVLGCGQLTGMTMSAS